MPNTCTCKKNDPCANCRDCHSVQARHALRDCEGNTFDLPLTWGLSELTDSISYTTIDTRDGAYVKSRKRDPKRFSLTGALLKGKDCVLNIGEIFKRPPVELQLQPEPCQLLNPECYYGACITAPYDMSINGIFYRCGAEAVIEDICDECGPKDLSIVVYVPLCDADDCPICDIDGTPICTIDPDAIITVRFFDKPRDLKETRDEFRKILNSKGLQVIDNNCQRLYNVEPQSINEVVSENNCGDPDCYEYTVTLEATDPHEYALHKKYLTLGDYVEGCCGEDGSYAPACIKVDFDSAPLCDADGKRICDADGCPICIGDGEKWTGYVYDYTCTDLNKVVGSACFYPVNDGCVQLFPEITITAETDITSLNFINETADLSFTYNGALNAGQTLLLDTEALTAQVDGVNVLANMTEGFYFGMCMLAGENKFRFEAVDEDACFIVDVCWLERWV